MKKETTDIPRISSSRRYPLLNVSGYMSTTAVTKLSTHTNCRRGDLIRALITFAPLLSCLFFYVGPFNTDPLFKKCSCRNWLVRGINHPHSWVHVPTEEESETLGLRSDFDWTPRQKNTFITIFPQAGWRVTCPRFLTWLSRPRKMSIMKKRQAQSGARGIMVTALGYAMNARPGPASWRHQTQEGHRFIEVSPDGWT